MMFYFKSYYCYIFIYLLIGILSLFSVHAQDYAYIRYTRNDGLAGNTVYGLLQDKKGYLWISTETGISRYDGYKFRNYTVEDGIPANEALTIFEDSKGRIWFCSLHKRPYYYDPNLERMITEKEDALIRQLPVGGEAFYEKKDGTVLFAGIYNQVGGGYPKCPPEWSNFIDYHRKNSIHYAYIVTAVWEENDTTYIRTNLELFKIHKNKIETIDKSKIQSYDQNYIRVFQKNLNRDGTCLHIYNESIFLCEKDQKKAIIAQRNVGEITEFNATKDVNNNILIATSRGALFVNPTNSKKNTTLLKGYTTRIYEDNQGNYWVGTRGNGLYFFNSKGLTIRQWTDFHSDKNISPQINSFYGLPNGGIMVGGDQGWAYHLNNQNQIEKHQTQHNGKINGFINWNKITWAYGDIGMHGFNTSPVNFSSNYNKIISGGIRSTFLDPLENKLIFTERDYIVIRPDVDTFYRIVEKNRIYSLAVHQNYVWIGLGQGLHRAPLSDFTWNELRKKKIIKINKRTGNFFYNIQRPYYDVYISYTFDSLTTLHKQHPELNEEIRCLLADKQGGLWVATLDHGLTYLRNGKHWHWDTRNGLRSSAIPSTQSLYEDSLGNIWVATMSGIHKVSFKGANKEPRLEYMFGYPEGLLSNETLCTFRQGDYLYIGSDAGLNRVDLKEYDASCRQAPSVFFTGIQVEDAPYPYQRLVSSKTALELPYDSNRVEIQFLGISLGRKVRYEFIAIKNGSDTIDRGFTSNLTYRFANLSAGDYLFLVRGSTGSDGCMGTYTTFKFTIRPHWLWSVWGISAQVILFLSFISWGAYRYGDTLKRKQRARLKALQKRIEELTLEARLAQIKPHFVSNALSAIRNKLLRQEWDLAHTYIVLFSDLARRVLDSSARLEIPLAEEIDTLKMYIRLQQLRFEDEKHESTFDFEIITDPAINPNKIVLPTMVLQPFIENAIEHGFRFEEFVQKKRKGKLIIEFLLRQNGLICNITDNGIGRNAALVIKKQLDMQKVSSGLTPRISRGMNITAERIASINALFYADHIQRITFEINDLSDSDGQPAGTQVLVVFPVEGNQIQIN